MLHRLILVCVPTLILTACIEAIGTNAYVDQPARLSSSSSGAADAKIIEPYPSEISVDHFRTMALSGTNLKIGSAIERGANHTKYFISYLSNGVKISGTLSLPSGDGPYPLIIQNHGYIDPAVYTNGRGLRREQAAFANDGFAVLHTDYRKHAQSDPDPDLRNIYDNTITYAMDSANAILAMRESNDPRIDTSKVGMIGHSMGGGVTMHVMVARPELVDAVILYAPINADAWANFTRWRIEDAEGSTETLAAFHTKDENPEAWAGLSQSGSLHLIDDPILLFHGTKDESVPYAWSEDFAAKLEELGKDSTFITYPGEGHEFSAKWPDFIKSSIGFFSEHLSKKDL